MMIDLGEMFKKKYCIYKRSNLLFVLNNNNYNNNKTVLHGDR